MPYKYIVMNRIIEPHVKSGERDWTMRPIERFNCSRDCLSDRIRPEFTYLKKL